MQFSLNKNFAFYVIYKQWCCLGFQNRASRKIYQFKLKFNWGKLIIHIIALLFCNALIDMDESAKLYKKAHC